MILEQVERETEDEWRPKRIVSQFRGSELGDCPRSIQYYLLGYEPERPKPELALLFSDGHLHHNSLRQRLSSVGRVTNTEQVAWKEYDIQGIKFSIGGTCDCHFNTFIGELKGINFFSFKNLNKESLPRFYKKYIDQIQAYLDIFDKEWGFLLFKCKMTSALKLFWIKRDREYFQKVLNRLAKIQLAIQHKKMLKRPFTKSSKKCKGCFMRKHCWGISMERREWK